MAIITINTTPISEFFINWINAIGPRGFMIITLCLLVYGCCSIILMIRKDARNKKIKHKRYYD